MSGVSVFSKHAQSYDQSRRQLVPCYEEFYGSAIEAMRSNLLSRFQSDPEEIQPVVLDLGAGTGLTAAMILREFPQARVVLFDASEAMLDQARARFQGTDAQVSFILGDFQGDPLPGLTDQYDAVFSGLAIHHLDGPQKRALFSKIGQLLRPGGIFVNADQVLGQTPEIEARYRSIWLEQVMAAGISSDALAASLERMKEDQMSPLEDQLGWLREVGFEQVNCWFKSYNFAVFSGIRNQ